MTISKLAVLLVAAATMLLAACGGEDQVSTEEFENRVSDARARAETALEDLTSAQSQDDLAGRLEQAADELRSSADELAGTDPPEGAQEATDRLVDGLNQLADQLDEAAADVEGGDLGSILDRARGEGLEAADDVRAALEELRQQGFEVGELGQP